MANAIRNGYSCDTWYFYKDKNKQWRWRRKALNHRIVGASTEGYHNRKDCLANARRHGYWGR